MPATVVVGDLCMRTRASQRRARGNFEARAHLSMGDELSPEQIERRVVDMRTDESRISRRLGS